MTRLNTLSFATLAFATRSIAQTLGTCDGNKQPDWDDCEKIASTFLDKTGSFANYYPQCTFASPPAGTDPDSLNCVIYVCPEGPDVYMTDSEMDPPYQILKGDCKPEKAGGNSEYQGFVMHVENNDNYNPPSSSAMLVTNSQNVTHPRLSNREQTLDRRHSRDMMKRQESGDNSYKLLLQSNSIEDAGHYEIVTGRLPSGSMYTISESNSKTTGISSTVSVSADFFEIFSASASVTVSQDYTTSNTQGVVVNVDCDSGQEGEILWYPLFTKYAGTYEPSGDEVDFLIPEDTQESGTNYHVRCLGD